jgi:hypothetical protein
MNLSVLSFLLLLILLLITPLDSTVYSDEEESSVSAIESETETLNLNVIPSYVQKKIYKKTWYEKKLDFPIRYACIGDVDGDGMNELISTDGEKLRIIQWEYGQFRILQDTNGKEENRSFTFWTWPRNRSKNPLDEVNKLNRGMHFISLSARDLDEDGQDEILYIAIKSQKLFSGLLRYENQQFTQYLSNAGLFLKVFQDDDGRPLLVGQSLQSENKKAYHYEWKGNTFQRGNPVPLPEGIPIFFLSSYRTGDASGPAFVSFTNPGELRFFSSDLREMAKMDSLKVPVQETIRIRMDRADHNSKKKKFRIPKRFLTGDFDGDGGDDLFLILTRPAFKLWGFRTLFKRNMVANLVFTNGQIQEFWDTKPIMGKILDQAVGDLDNNGRDDLVLFTRKGLIPFNKGTRLLIYELR